MKLKLYQLGRTNIGSQKSVDVFSTDELINVINTLFRDRKWGTIYEIQIGQNPHSTFNMKEDESAYIVFAKGSGTGGWIEVGICNAKNFDPVPTPLTKSDLILKINELLQKHEMDQLKLISEFASKLRDLLLK